MKRQHKDLTSHSEALLQNLDTFSRNASKLNHPTDVGEHPILGGAHDAISYGRQSFLRHTIVAISVLKTGSTFLHMKHPYDLVGWISLVIVLHVHKNCMRTNYHPVYNKACNHSDNNQFPERPCLNLSLF